MHRKGHMWPEIPWNVNQNQWSTTCLMGVTYLVSIALSQQHPHTWIHTYYKTPLISVGETEIPWDTWLSHRALSISYGGNIFPKEIVFLLWRCWRCAICKRKSENLHSRGDRLVWWWDESGAPLSQIWAREESATDPSAEGIIESSTGPGELNDTQPNPERLLVPQTQALTLTAAQPVKYQVKHACCATGRHCCFIGGELGGGGDLGDKRRENGKKQKLSMWAFLVGRGYPPSSYKYVI